MTHPIYHDNGAAFGRRTRFFREAQTGIEWMYGVDYCNGDSRWYALHSAIGRTIAELIDAGMFLSRLDNGTQGVAA